jgi:hypothetical protein
MYTLITNEDFDEARLPLHQFPQCQDNWLGPLLHPLRNHWEHPFLAELLRDLPEQHCLGLLFPHGHMVVWRMDSWSASSACSLALSF